MCSRAIKKNVTKIVGVENSVIKEITASRLRAKMPFNFFLFTETDTRPTLYALTVHKAKILKLCFVFVFLLQVLVL